MKQHVETIEDKIEPTKHQISSLWEQIRVYFFQNLNFQISRYYLHMMTL